jgi:hypothetical protein
MLEHVFIAELLKEAWFRRQATVEVLRSEVDNSGYDLVLDHRDVVRHVQLKASKAGGRAAKQNINIKLATKPSGCVIWIVFEGNKDEGLSRLRYLFFGGKPGEKLPSLDRFKVARQTRANARGVKAQRPAIREVPKSSFKELPGIEDVFTSLFG